MPEFDLINMNGRMYDPLLGRMLSPDNFVQDATSTQGFNRYAYAFNNPLKYTDPTGENANSAMASWGMIGWGDIFLSWSPDFQMSALQFQYDMSTWHNAAPPLFLQGGAPGNSFAGNSHINNINTQFDMELFGAINKAPKNNSNDVLDKEFLASLSGITLPVTTIEALRNDPYGVFAFWDEFLAQGGGGTPGINVYESSLMSGGITVPPLGIFVQKGAGQGLKQHEYGHYLQYKNTGFLSYYKNVGVPSLYNATENAFENLFYGGLKYSVDHHYFRTETDANRRSQGFYDNPKAPVNSWPTDTRSSPHTWDQRLILYGTDMWNYIWK